MEALKKAASNSDQVRLKITLSLIASIGAIWTATILLPDNIIFHSPASITITAGIPLAAALLIIARQGQGGLYGKTHIALAIGLACWFAGELIWTYDNMIVGKEPMELSSADIPWLALYTFFGYYIFKTYRFFGFAVNRYHVIAVVAVVAAITATSTYLNLSLLDQGSLAVAMVRLSYPIADAILIIPSVLLLITLRHGLLTYTPWMFSSSALILIAVADILFSNISLFGTIDMYKVVFPLYNAGNLTFAGALLWYNKFSIYDQGRAKWTFQERNK